ncbi:glycosyltransferase [Candidatus Pacearchaeota archaeon]|nr:glycosyltransferase [Candidatus Pacearchaeota archaeon]
MEKQEKFGKIVYAGIVNKFYAGYQHGYLVLKEVADEIIPFDYRLVNLKYGRKEMNKRFIDLIEKEKPDFVLIYSIVDEFDVETYLKIREVSPDTRSIMFYGDDDCMYESFTRFYKLLFDNIIVFQKDFMYKYNEEKNIQVDFMFATNFDCYYPVKTKKIYDVSFFGIPEYDREEYIRYLMKNKIKVDIFGRNWHDKPEFLPYYHGNLPFEEFIKAMSQSKITLNFSKNRFGKIHFKGRIFEAASCNAFQLVEYTPTYAEFFKEGSEVIMFKTKEELLKQVKYYLKNEKERKIIANNAYNKLKKNKYGFKYDLIKYLKKYYKNPPIHPPLPKVSQKIYEITKKHINFSKNQFTEILKDYDLVCFNKNILKKIKHKEYFQIYAHEKSNKDLTCCSFYLAKKNIGIYLFCNSNEVFQTNKDHFTKMLDINTISAKKEYFLNNINVFKDLFKSNNKKHSFITKENTNFIQIPLVYLPKLNYIKYKDMKPYLLPKFLYNLYSLRHKKKLMTDPYIYNLLLEITKGNYFLLWLLVDALKKPYYREKEKELSGQVH